MLKNQLEVWDGRSSTRKTDKYAAPDAGDWGRVIHEIQKIQKIIIETTEFYSGNTDDNISVGQPLELGNKLKLANRDVIGIAISDTNPIIYVVRGKLTLDNWINVINNNFLKPNVYYYLSMTEPGKLTTVAPTIVNDVVIEIGRAQNKNQLAINIKTPIYL